MLIGMLAYWILPASAIKEQEKKKQATK
jgi:hypothetical protein